VDLRAMFVSPGLEPVLPSGRLSYIARSPLEDGERKGGLILLPLCLERAHRRFLELYPCVLVQTYTYYMGGFYGSGSRRGTKTPGLLCDF
jgi:hypothetical protein